MLAIAVISILSLLPLFVSALAVRNNNGSSKKPNFIYIITDDQDAGIVGKDIMPKLAKYVAEPGQNYTHFYAPVSQCCPSRVGFFRGQFGHTHNVTYVAAPYGGYNVFCEFGYQIEWLPTWLQRAAYNTYYVGKLMNGNNAANAQTLPVRGLNESAILLDPSSYLFDNHTFSFNSGPPQNFEGQYSTDLIRDIGLDNLDKALEEADRPFFVGIAPIAPHFAWSNYTGARPTLPPVPAERHQNLFLDRVAPRGASFNPDEPSGASFMRNLAKLNDTLIEYNDDWYRKRLQSLQAVDELVEAVYKKVEAAGQLDNTYIMYTADNGYSISQHRRNPGKTTGYEEDIRIPFTVRGPGIKPGVDSASAFSNIDLTASILHLAGAEANIDLDGKLMPFAQESASRKQIGSPHIHLSEFWIFAQDEGIYSIPARVTQNNTYRVVRSIDETSNWAYAVWCTGERELYDMNADPGQMNNLLLPLNEQGPFAPIQSSVAGGRVASRLDAVMLYLKNCRGAACRFGWENLFPYGEATSLAEALDPNFDAHFDSLPKVRYDVCGQGYFLEREFPQWTTDLAYWSRPQVANGSLPIPGRRRSLVDAPFGFPDGAEA